MSKQPEALVLASYLATFGLKSHDSAAAELRRLHALNAELLEALKRLMQNFPTDFDLQAANWGKPEIEAAMSAHDFAREVISKAEEQQ